MKTQNAALLNKLTIFSLVGCLLSVLASAPAALAAPPITVRSSLSSEGVEANNNSYAPVLSDNGYFVAFTSYADNLVVGDDFGTQDIFVRNLKTKETQRVSVDSAGVAGNNYSNYPALSANGRLVAFTSAADNLVTRDSNDAWDVFVRNLTTGETQRVSVDSSGAEGKGYSYSPSFSANGRLIAYGSSAANLVGNDNNNKPDVFVHDIKTGETQRVSVDSAGVEGNGASFNISLSANGRFATFESEASNLVAGDTNGTSDVFVRDLETGVTQRVSVNSEGVEGKGVSGSPTLSTSGRYVAFTSNANNLVARDTNRNYDVFVHDLITKKTRRVSLSSAGAEGNSQSSAPKISANGRYVVFESSASNLVAEDKNGVLDVFVRDLATGVTKIISVDSVDVKGNSESRMPSISGSGRYVAFSSTASNLVEGDNLGFEDIFVRRQW